MTIGVMQIQRNTRNAHNLWILVTSLDSGAPGTCLLRQYLTQARVHIKNIIVFWAGLFCDGTRRYGVPGNENDESI